MVNYYLISDRVIQRWAAFTSIICPLLQKTKAPDFKSSFLGSSQEHPTIGRGFQSFWNPCSTATMDSSVTLDASPHPLPRPAPLPQPKPQIPSAHSSFSSVMRSRPRDGFSMLGKGAGGGILNLPPQGLGELRISCGDESEEIQCSSSGSVSASNPFSLPKRKIANNNNAQQGAPSGAVGGDPPPVLDFSFAPKDFVFGSGSSGSRPSSHKVRLTPPGSPDEESLSSLDQSAHDAAPISPQSHTADSPDSLKQELDSEFRNMKSQIQESLDQLLGKFRQVALGPHQNVGLLKKLDTISTSLTSLEKAQGTSKAAACSGSDVGPAQSRHSPSRPSPGVDLQHQAPDPSIPDIEVGSKTRGTLCGASSLNASSTTAGNLPEDPNPSAAFTIGIGLSPGEQRNVAKPKKRRVRMVTRGRPR